MSAETLIGAAAGAAFAAVGGIRRIQSLPDDSFLITTFSELVSFYVHFSPSNSEWQYPIRAALPFLRGVRTSKGVRFSSYRTNCYHEALLKVVQGHHRWLGRHAVFQPLALYLRSKCLGLFGKGAAWWQ